MTLQGRRVVVLAERQYEDLELWYPKLRLREAGADVLVAGTGERLYLSKHGYPVTADAAVADLRPRDFDGVVIPGGWAPDYLRRHQSVTGFVRSLAEEGKLVAAICHGGSVLVSAGVLQGRRVTSVVAIRDDLTNAGATWSDAAVVVDGNLVTSRRPDDLDVFLPAVIGVLEIQGHTDQSLRLAVDADLIVVRLEDVSFAYMVDMLNRMPHAKAYKGADFDPGTMDPASILAAFAAESDPKGSLEAEPVTVIDVRRSDDGSYQARGNARLHTVLEAADVPSLSLAAG
jgi:protease I